MTIWISPRVVPWVGPASLILAFVLTFFTWLEVPKDEGKELTAWGLAFGGKGNGLMVLYVLLLILAVVLSLAVVILPRLSIPLPHAIQQIMPWRSGIVGGITLLAFLFLALQLLIGLGEETAAGEHQAFRTNWLRLALLVNLTAAVATALEFWLVLRKSRPLPRIDIIW